MGRNFRVLFVALKLDLLYNNIILDENVLYRLVEILQLKRLEAHGFKSFADKIEIEFDHGVTAVVGPNGSGKSNITDAIRWVLGERNVRNLRGTKTEDIIFAGSS